MVAGVGATAGEEIGWRGCLVPELAKVLPFTGVALLSGFIWASWHSPITAVVYRDAGLPPRLRTDSVAADLPARQPQLVDAIDLFPADQRTQRHQVGRRRPGLAFVVVAAVVAAVFWAKRRDLPNSVDAQRA